MIQSVNSPHPSPASNIGNHLSNERTYLSQLRTSIAFMSFGITLNRFSIYLQEQDRSGSLLLRDGKNFGLGMIIMGMLLLGWSQYRFELVTRQVDEGNYTPPSMAFTILTTIVIMMGACGTIWLMRN